MANLVTDYEDPEQELEDQKKRQDPNAPIGKPLIYGPQEPAAVKAETNPMTQPTTPSVTVPTSMPAPDVGAVSPPPMQPTISGAAPYSPAQPTAQGASDYPQQSRLNDLTAKGPPNYFGATTPTHKRNIVGGILDTIANGTAIGRNIEQATGLGSLGYDTKLKRAENDVTAGNLPAKEEAQTRQLQGTAAEAQARAQETTAGSVPENVNTSAGPLSVLRKNVAPIVAADVRGQTTLGQQELKNQEATDLEGQKEASPLEQAKTGLANAQADLAKFRANPNSPMYRIAQEHLRIAQGDYALKLKEFGFNYEPSILTPQEQSTMPTDQAGNVVGLHNPLKPNATTVNAAQRATNVVSQLPRLTQEIQEMQGSIGPDVGRWNRFWQGDVGAADPKFAHLRDDMEYLSSAVALAHAYGRLPASISSKFDAMYEAGKQDPANMLAAMQVAGEWLPKIAKGGQTAGEQGSPLAPPKVPSAPGGPVSAGPPKFGDWQRQQGAH